MTGMHIGFMLDKPAKKGNVCAFCWVSPQETAAERPVDLPGRDVKRNQVMADEGSLP